MTGKTLQKQYIREVQKELFCPRKLQKKFLEELNGSLDTYLEKHPNTTMEDIYARFGSSSELAETYLKTVDPEELTKQVRIARTIRRTLIAVGVAIVLLFAIVVVVMIIDNHNSRQSYSSIVLTDEGDISTDTTSDIQVEETP